MATSHTIIPATIYGCFTGTSQSRVIKEHTVKKRANLVIDKPTGLSYILSYIVMKQTIKKGMI